MTQSPERPETKASDAVRMEPCEVTQEEKDLAARHYGYESWNDAQENGGKLGGKATLKLAKLLARHRLNARPLSVPKGEEVERYRHVARGTEYCLIGTAELQDAAGKGVDEGALLAIYRGDDGKWWARRHSEFGDGRFERLVALSTKEPESVTDRRMKEAMAADLPGYGPIIHTIGERPWWLLDDDIVARHLPMGLSERKAAFVTAWCHPFRVRRDHPFYHGFGQWSLKAPAQGDVERIRAQAFEDAAKVADNVARECQTDAHLSDEHDDSARAAGGMIEAERIAKKIRALASMSPTLSPKAEGAFQQRVQPWIMECFGAEISADRMERNHRFLEEALELVQACECTEHEANQLVRYVFNRPAGEKGQEVGGVMVTLAALCLAQGLDMHAEGERELARIWTKVEQIRAKQAAKPRHSPLPATPFQGKEPSNAAK